MDHSQFSECPLCNRGFAPHGRHVEYPDVEKILKKYADAGMLIPMFITQIACEISGQNTPSPGTFSFKEVFDKG